MRALVQPVTGAAMALHLVEDIPVTAVGRHASLNSCHINYLIRSLCVQMA
jgi:hypothetical protein